MNKLKLNSVSLWYLKFAAHVRNAMSEREAVLMTAARSPNKAASFALPAPLSARLCSTETQAWDSNALSSFGGGSRHTVGSDALRGHGYPHNPPDICTNGMGFGVDLRTKRHVEE